jgi:hypothetical protein
MHAIEQGGAHAVPAAHQVGKEWLPPYRETTGYIIPTLLDLSDHFARPELASTAKRLGEWLGEAQGPSGGSIEHDHRQDIGAIAFNSCPPQASESFVSLILVRG